MKEADIILKFSYSFIKKQSQERVIYELKSLKKRTKFISKIGGMPAFFKAEKFVSVKKSELLTFDKISSQSACYVISGFGNYDALVMTFYEAIRSPYFGSSATIVYDFNHNKLVYHEELCFGSPTLYFGAEK